MAFEEALKESIPRDSTRLRYAHSSALMQSIDGTGSGFKKESHEISKDSIMIPKGNGFLSNKDLELSIESLRQKDQLLNE